MITSKSDILPKSFFLWVGMPSTTIAFKFGIELMELLFPVVEKRGRADDERAGFFVFIMVLRDGRNRLQSFAKAHIVGEDSVQIHQPKPSPANGPLPLDKAEDRPSIS